MDYGDIIGDGNITEEGKQFLAKTQLKSKEIDRLRKEIKELDEDMPKLFKGNFNKTTQNLVFVIREKKEERLKDILENGIK